MHGRVFAKLAVIPLLLYIAVCVGLFFAQRRLIYQPGATWPVRQAPNFALSREHGVILRGWVVNPGQSRALLYFGGNGERLEDEREEFAQWFPLRTIYLVAYRGYAASDGDPSEVALIGDAQALFDTVSPHHATVAVAGRSLGSGVAVQLAASRPVERLALVTPFDSLEAVAQAQYPWAPVRWVLKDRYESWRYAAQVHCPVLLLRAERDELVLPERTLHLAQSFHPAPVMQVIADADHNSIGDDPTYARTLRQFLQ